MAYSLPIFNWPILNIDQFWTISRVTFILGTRRYLKRYSSALIWPLLIVKANDWLHTFTDELMSFMCEITILCIDWNLLEKPKALRVKKVQSFKRTEHVFILNGWNWISIFRLLKMLADGLFHKSKLTYWPRLKGCEKDTSPKAITLIGILHRTHDFDFGSAPFSVCRNYSA